MLTGHGPAPHLGTPPRIALVRTDQRLEADPDARTRSRPARGSCRPGANVVDATLPADYDGLMTDHPIVMAYEAVRSLAWEWNTHRDLVSTDLGAILEDGEAIDPDDYDRVLARAVSARAASHDLFGDADVVLTLAATGEALAGLESTGAPRFARLWTLLGFPAITVPGMTGATGLPIGVQLVGRRGDDARAACAEWLAAALPPAAVPVLR